MNEQRWNPTDYARHAGFVAAFGGELVDLLDPVAGARVLDLGCGDGALTAAVAARGFDVLGLDASPAQVAAARARGLEAEVGDGERLDFERAFDAILSNAALHWMRDQRAVLAGVWRALRPGGCFVGELGGAGNVASVVAAASELLAARGVDPAAYNPWRFPSVDHFQGLLEAQGFALEFIMLFPRPTPLPGPVDDWLRLFAQSFAAAVPEPERDAFYFDLARRLAPRLRAADGRWVLDYVRLRFKARRPA
jgi:trans-aconitate methyltransferase